MLAILGFIDRFTALHVVETSQVTSIIILGLFMKLKQPKYKNYK